jgi:hypothetical protein
VYVVLLVGYPELGVQAAFTDAGRARAFAAASQLPAFVDETDLHGRDCCEPHPLVAISQS